jgi:hypothetical protein
MKQCELNDELCDEAHLYAMTKFLPGVVFAAAL